MISAETMLRWMILLIVLATATPKPKAAIKLKNAANPTACLGVSTLVDTTVAIELAASWKPFVKSKAKATIIMMITRTKVSKATMFSPPSCVLARDL
jgi:hypothetical protein